MVASKGAATWAVVACLLLVGSSYVEARGILQAEPMTPGLGATVEPGPGAALPLITQAAPPALNATDIAELVLNETIAANATAPVSTIFAPTDAAFQELAAALNLTSPLDLFNATLNATTTNITELHVIPGVLITSASLVAGSVITVPSLLGYNLTIATAQNGTVTVTVPGSGIVATVLTPDVPYNTSVVHVIDKVLLPPMNETSAALGALPPMVNQTATGGM